VPRVQDAANPPLAAAYPKAMITRAIALGMGWR